MSRGLNKVFLVGRLREDPEIRTLPNGSRLARFTLATSRRWTDARGLKHEQTQWHTCVAWNDTRRGLADQIEQTLRKGAPLYCEGELQYRQFQDRDGRSRTVSEIKLQDVWCVTASGERAPLPAHTARRTSAAPPVATAAPARPATVVAPPRRAHPAPSTGASTPMPPAPVPVTTAPVTTAPVTTAPVTTAPVTTGPVSPSQRPSPRMSAVAAASPTGTAGAYTGLGVRYEDEWDGPAPF